MYNNIVYVSMHIAYMSISFMQACIYIYTDQYIIQKYKEYP